MTRKQQNSLRRYRSFPRRQGIRRSATGDSYQLRMEHSSCRSDFSGLVWRMHPTFLLLRAWGLWPPQFFLPRQKGLSTLTHHYAA
jgi:hypothetical protein